MKVFFDALFVVAQEVTQPQKHGAPDTGSQEGVEREGWDMHPPDAGRQGDVLAHPGNQPTPKGAGMAVFGEEIFHFLQRFFFQKKILAILLQKGSAKLVADGVVKERAGQTPAGSSYPGG